MNKNTLSLLTAQQKLKTITEMTLITPRKTLKGKPANESFIDSRRIHLLQQLMNLYL
jgi:hypothetical protein